MLHQLYKFSHHKHFILACSGGVDSMAVADFYKKGNKKFTLAYFDHGTGNAVKAIPLLEEWSKANDIELVVGTIQNEKPKDTSPEEHWRNERYRWLISLDRDIITCHHLGDVVEQWIFSSLHGNPSIIKPCNMISSYGENATVYRPFLTNTKDDFIKWCLRNRVKWHEDSSNTDTHYPRNYIRHNLVERCLKINPGLFKTIKKKVLAIV